MKAFYAVCISGLCIFSNRSIENGSTRDYRSVEDGLKMIISVVIQLKMDPACVDCTHPMDSILAKKLIFIKSAELNG